MSSKITLSAVLYLDVLVFFSEVHQTMVGLDGFTKLPDISAHNDKVLPDLPLFVVTLQGFLQGTKGFVSANETDRKRKTETKELAVLQKCFC